MCWLVPKRCWPRLVVRWRCAPPSVSALVWRLSGERIRPPVEAAEGDRKRLRLLGIGGVGPWRGMAACCGAGAAVGVAVAGVYGHGGGRGDCGRGLGRVGSGALVG